MRFVTRTFLWSFIPFVILLLGSFWAIQKLVEYTVTGWIAFLVAPDPRVHGQGPVPQRVAE